MAWSIRPGFRGDLVLCDEVENSEYRKPLRTRAGYEPARWCAESRAACSVACLEWICGKRGPCGRLLWPDRCRYRFWKPYLQKRLRAGSFCGGKHLGCLLLGADRGLQYGLSGNRVRKLATLAHMDQMGTACTATAGSVW